MGERINGQFVNCVRPKIISGAFYLKICPPAFHMSNLHLNSFCSKRCTNMIKLFQNQRNFAVSNETASESTRASTRLASTAKLARPFGCKPQVNCWTAENVPNQRNLVKAQTILLSTTRICVVRGSTAAKCFVGLLPNYMVKLFPLILPHPVCARPLYRANLTKLSFLGSLEPNYRPRGPHRVTTSDFYAEHCTFLEAPLVKNFGGFP